MSNIDFTRRADYIIIGAGSSGCVASSRLSEDGKNSVLVLEYGGTDIGPLIQMPSALSYPMNMSRYDWGFVSEPEPYANNRRLVVPRGKVIGGSSSINGMVYVRGHARDYDHWQESGADGWSYKDVQPYFERSETSHDGAKGEGRGTNGPLQVRKGAAKNPLYRAFIEAGSQAGFETTEDYNGLKQEGFGVMEQTIHKGERWSAAKAYLRPALKRKNLELKKCFVRRLIIEDNKAIGVEIESQGKISYIGANKEVILASSTINSPKLLMLSGIGPADHLRDHNISVIADRQGVGSNLQDHPELYIQQSCLQPITLYKNISLFSKALIGLRWLLLKDGLGATNHFESVAFVRSRAGIDYPDIQYHFLPIAIRYDGKLPAQGHGFQAHVGPMRTHSRGTVRLTDSDPTTPPKILFNYLQDERDLSDFRHCIRLTRTIFSQPAFDSYRGDEITPGISIQSDEDLNEHIRDHIESAYHPCGTLKMGSPADPMSVVDSECRVIGIDSLRVIDTSIFPRITNGNLNGAAIMTAEKASDHILGRPLLSPSNLEPWINPRWRESDR